MELHGKRTDPYRVLFPFGILIGIAGVSIWPAYYFGLTAGYSGRAHAFVQIEGFVYAFVAGFLLTAIPRFTGTEAPGRTAQFILAGLILSSAAAFEFQIERAGHIGFLIAHVFVITLVASRYARKRNPPPETFPLVGLGLLAGLIGGTVNAAIAWQALEPSFDLLGKRLLTEGMLLLLVLGIGSFLGPRLMGFAQIPDFEKMGRLAGKTGLSFLERNQSYILALTGAAIIASLIAEYRFQLGWAAYLRAALATAIIAAKIHPWRLPAVRTTLAWCVWMSFLFLLFGLWISAAAPPYRVDFLHIVFIGSFTLLILAVGTRVALSHGGHSLSAEQRSWVLRIGAAAVIIAMFSRAGAPFAAESFFEHLAIAALLWIAALAVWGYYVMGLLRRDPKGSGSRSSK